MARPSPRWPYEAAFKLEVPDLGPPDADGWAVGTCPACRTPRGLKANLLTGKWLCLPAGASSRPRLPPPPRRSLRPVPGGRHAG